MNESATVLLLDDDPMVTRSLEALIGSETEWDVRSFNSTQLALDALGNGERVDAVVSDYLMPEMDGIKFLTRAQQLQPAATRILLTGYADKGNAIRSINEARLYHYIEKPWNNDDLLLVLRNALERTRLLRQVADALDRLAERDRDMGAIRDRLLKAIL